MTTCKCGKPFEPAHKHIKNCDDCIKARREYEAEKVRTRGERYEDACTWRSYHRWMLAEIGHNAAVSKKKSNERKVARTAAQQARLDSQAA